MAEEMRQRKMEHVALSLQHDIAAPQSASWADVRLVHRALPEVDLDEVNLATEFLGCRLRAPLVISSMTGGHPDVAEINGRLAALAEEFGLAMGVGSQRAALVNPELEGSYRIVRDRAPHAFLLANVGAPQLIPQARHRAFTVEDVRRAVEMIGANALALHLNFLQEAAQPEGDRRAKGCLAALAGVAGEIGVPVVAKETGAGVGFEAAQAFVTAGASAIDVGGAGGSSMAAMETLRAERRGDDSTAALGRLFRDWGIPTPIAVVETRAAAPELPVIATGGIRSGLDAARALALGATVVAVGYPFLQAASEGEAALRTYLAQFLGELRVAMQLTGAGRVEALREVPAVVTGATREWLDLRGFEGELRALARRGRAQGGAA